MDSLPSPALNPVAKLVNFTKFPSWVSLNRSSSLTKVPETLSGSIENAHLVSLSRQGKLKEAHEFLNVMDANDVPVTSHSYECLFESCGKTRSLSLGRLFHYRLRKDMKTSYGCGKNLPGSLGNTLTRMYFDCGCMVAAQKVFDEMPIKDLASWRMLLSAYAQHGLYTQAFILLSQMASEGLDLNSTVCVSLIRAISAPSGLQLGKQIHSHVIRIGLMPDPLIESALVNMYVRCGWLEDAMFIFNRMNEKSVVTWTDLMVGHTTSGKYEEALNLFVQMIQKRIPFDQFVFSVSLKACSKLECPDRGKQIHGLVAKTGMGSDVSVGTPLVDFYVKCGSLKEARQAFERISHPNEVSWSSIISGYSQSGYFEESVRMFKYMRSRGMDMNSFIYTTIFQVCAALADLNMGSQLHCDGIKRGLISDLYGESALVTMYSRSGRLDYAYQAFESIKDPDTVAWTAIIAGSSYHGHASRAMELFRRMLSQGMRPNSITFVAIFTACSHSGLVSEARQYLDSMGRDYGVEPTIEHYNCMVDIHCRAGQLSEAFELAQSMKFEPDAMTWKILLGGCGVHGNIELGMLAGENLLQIDPTDTAAYVLLFNLYISGGRWEDAAHIRKLMNERNVRKAVSCSWIAIKGKVHRFIVGDRHHSQTTEIYSKLEELNHLLTSSGSSLPANSISSDLDEERSKQLLDHSERLAIAFGLISTSSNAPILVFKNLRVCSDCHDFTKHVSRITGREIIVRDSCRFHHFKAGGCSCKDFW